MRSVLVFGLLITCVLLPTPRRCIAPNRPRATYVRANVLLFPRATPFPVGPTNRPVTGWIAPQGQKAEPTAAGLG